LPAGPPTFGSPSTGNRVEPEEIPTCSFCNTPRGARASAVVYSIVETAKENGLIPFEYLRYLFERLPNLDDGDLDELLPWSDSLPDTCRAGKHA